MSAPERVVVERVVPGGRGFARLADGRAAFVRGGLPGDEVRLRVVADRKSFVEAEVTELLGPSPERVEPPCRYARRCGGCDFMELGLEAQRRHKRLLLLEALGRTGGLSPEALAGVPAVRSAPPSEGYRLRLRLQVRGGRVGFFSPGSHDLVEVEACLVASREVNELLTRLRALTQAHPKLFEAVEFIEARALPGAAPARERTSLFFSLRKGQRASAELRRILGGLDVPVRVGERDPIQLQRYFVTDDVFVETPIGGFCQVHPGVNRALVEEVLAAARASGSETFLDLYSGSGNFSLPLARQGLAGLGVELSAEATDAAERGRLEQGLSRVSFRAADVAKEAARLAAAGRRYDLVVVDPPRRGAWEALEALARLASKRLVLVSCDPVTLARDLKRLLELGARLERLEAWDMFPQTHHVESFAVLTPPHEA